MMVIAFYFALQHKSNGDKPILLFKFQNSWWDCWADERVVSNPELPDWMNSLTSWHCWNGEVKASVTSPDQATVFNCLFAEERRIGIHLRPSSSSFTLRGAATARSWSRSGSTSSSRSTASPSGWQESTAPGSPPSTQSSTLSDIRPSCCEFLLFRLSFESSCKGGLKLSRCTLT